MRHFAFILFTLWVVAALGSRAEAQKLSPAEQEVVDASHARMDAAARRDMATWARYVAEDCIFSADGNALTKAQMMEHYTKVPAEYDRAMEPREYLVHLYGDTAIVTYRSTDHEQYGADDLKSEERRTETQVKRNGSWQLVAIAWGGPSINYRKPAVVDGKLFPDYVGQYQARPKDEVETISIKDGKLWSQTGSEGDWCLPAGGDTFFYKSDWGSLTFSRDGQGRVTGYVYRRVDGQEIVNRKIK